MCVCVYMFVTLAYVLFYRQRNAASRDAQPGAAAESDGRMSTGIEMIEPDSVAAAAAAETCTVPHAPFILFSISSVGWLLLLPVMTQFYPGEW